MNVQLEDITDCMETEPDFSGTQLFLGIKEELEKGGVVRILNFDESLYTEFTNVDDLMAWIEERAK